MGIARWFPGSSVGVAGGLVFRTSRRDDAAAPTLATHVTLARQENVLSVRRLDAKRVGGRSDRRSTSELSDGTLRYVLWIAALLTPRPPSLMVLNEPETSLHADLLPALARLTIRASEKAQVWVVSHSARLIAALNQSPECHSIELEKELGETRIAGQGMLDQPAWHWPDKG
jgi:predicted ATPase